MLSQNASGQLLILPRHSQHCPASANIASALPQLYLTQTSPSPGLHGFRLLFWFHFCCYDNVLMSSNLGEKRIFFSAYSFRVLSIILGKSRQEQKNAPIVKSREKQMYLCQLPVSYSVSPLFSCKVQASEPGNSVSHSRLSQLTSKSVCPTDMSAGHPNLHNFSV